MKIKKYIVIFLNAIILTNILMYAEAYAVNGNAEANQNNKLGVAYRTHVQDIGWQNYVTEGKMAGTEGQAKRLEGINIKLLNNKENISINYLVHVQDIGWQGWKTDDEMAGTSGRSLRLEGIKINLSNSNNYSIMYRVHVQDIGWQGWKTEGEMAGTEGQSKRLETIEIKIVEKSKFGMLHIDTPSNGASINSYQNNKISVSGWKMSNAENSFIKAYMDNNLIDSNLISYVERKDVINSIKGYGTESQNPTPGFKFDTNISNLSEGNHTIKIELYYENIVLANKETTFYIDNEMHIKYQAHVENIGWQSWQSDEGMAGTEGRALRVEALKIQLENAPSNIHIKYRTHVQDIGWQDWKTDGQLAGTE